MYFSWLFFRNATFQQHFFHQCLLSTFFPPIFHCPLASSLIDTPLFYLGFILHNAGISRVPHINSPFLAPTPTSFQWTRNKLFFPWISASTNWFFILFDGWFAFILKPKWYHDRLRISSDIYWQVILLAWWSSGDHMGVRNWTWVSCIQVKHPACFTIAPD